MAEQDDAWWRRYTARTQYLGAVTMLIGAVIANDNGWPSPVVATFAGLAVVFAAWAVYLHVTKSRDEEVRRG